jgi:hypothetical protein
VLLGGLGYFSSNNSYNEVISAQCCGSIVDANSISSNGLMATVGMEWRFGRFGTRYGLRVEYEWWDLKDIDSSTIGIALSYGF